MSMQTLFDNATQIPTIPKVVQELMDAFRADNVSADFIGETLAKDPSLTAKVLRLANSAHFGGNRKISSCNDATVLLGLDTLRTLVLASGVTGAFEYPASIDRKQFWQDSFDIASICKWLAVRANDQDKEAAFTCGMLHQIGAILIAMEKSDDAAKINQAVLNGASRNELEQDTFGYTSNQVSSELASRWRFPDAFLHALSAQDDPSQAESDSDLASLLNVAKYIHKARQVEDGKEALVNDFPLDTAKVAGLNSSEILAEIDDVIELSSDLADLID